MKLSQVGLPLSIANVGKWDLSPVASEIETQTIRWLAEFIGYPNDCGGIMVSGGNMANFVCFLAARRAKAPFDVQREGLAGKKKMIVYASSAAVAGKIEDYGGRISDDARHVPMTHYGVFKAANEGNARVYFADAGISSVGLRPYTVYGVGREIGVTSAPTKAIKAAVLGRAYTIPFSGPTSFVYVEDLAEIFIRAARSGHEGAVALNIRGQVETVSEFLARLCEVLPEAGRRITCEGDPVPIAFDFDESGLEALLGSDVPRTAIRKGIQRTVDHFERLARSRRLHDRDLI